MIQSPFVQRSSGRSPRGARRQRSHPFDVREIRQATGVGAVAVRGDGPLRDRLVPGARPLRKPGRAAVARRGDVGNPDRRLRLVRNRGPGQGDPRRCGRELRGGDRLAGSRRLHLPPGQPPRLHTLPPFGPPGHGLVCLAGLRISQSRAVRRNRRAFVGGAVAIAAAWGLSGLWLLGRTDVLGAITGAALVYVLLRGRAAPLYAGVFLIVGFLEVYGTSIGAWHWAATTPGTPLPAGNPPSGIAGVYVLFDILAIALAPRVGAALTTLGRLVPF